MSTNNDDEPVELNIGADTVGYIISMARRFDAESGSLEPDLAEPETGASIADLEAGRGERTSAEDPTTEELREAIDDLNDDEVVDLIALAWVGRGDFSRGEWEQARSLARERHREHSAGYLMGMPALGDYLEEGLATLGHVDQES